MTKSKLLLLPLLIAACADDPVPTPCTDGLVRDEAAGTCVMPLANCDGADPKSIAADCATKNRVCFADALGAVCGLCKSGFRENGESCVAITACSALSCASEGRDCVEATARTDAVCGECLPELLASGDACVQKTCERDGTPGSILDQCESQLRRCETSGTTASCGPCFAKHLEENGACRPVVTCQRLGCTNASRVCELETTAADARCGPCRAGYADVAGICAPLANAVCAPAPAVGSILDACTTEGRSCNPDPAGASCGDCATGLFDVSGTGVCTTPVACSALDCAAGNRSCEDQPYGRCTTCLPGFTEDVASGSCRPVIACSDLSCVTGEECAEASDNEDAYCRMDCGPNAIWGGIRCEPCPTCDAPGEVGRYRAPTSAGNCICETQTGYFYSVAADVGTFLCDSDNDGWVRESARVSLESSDPVLRNNARCTLRSIDRFTLKNEAGQTREVGLPAPLALYETDRNDDQAVLDEHWRLRGLPGYGPSGEIVRASELNRLTKICHHPRADYNDNGAADVVDWPDAPPGPAVRPDQIPFNQLSYFVELNQGHYEAPASGSGPGRYLVEEKSRSGGSATSSIALNFSTSDGDYWRQCRLAADAEFPIYSEPVGMDFAQIPPDASFAGMGLHSLFKCLVFDDQPDTSIPTEITPSEAAARGYRLNQCSERAPAVARTGNPSEPVLGCRRVAPSSAEAGDVLWAAIPYLPNGPAAGNTPYLRGCVDDCVDAISSCPGYSVNPVAVECFSNAADFGRFTGCYVAEVCDGLDNDLNGPADEGDPGGGLPCDTGQLGQCRAGTTHCLGGRIECVRDTGPSADVCDGIDNNCDGPIDENNPGSGVGCTVPGALGICSVGLTTCSNGAIICPQIVQPGSEACDGLDNDCNGPVDEGMNLGGCTNYYYDGDGDGWGGGASNFQCLCGPDATTKYSAPQRMFGTTIRFDCCDSDGGTYPRTGGSYSATANACSDYDTNCDGLRELDRTATAVAGCGTCCSGFCCCGGANGWANSAPACGTSHTYYQGGCSSWSSCSQNSTTYTAACR